MTLKYLLVIFFIMIIAMTVIVSGCTTGANDLSKVNSTRAAEVVWQNTYGGPHDDMASSAIRTSDGGYAITGINTIFYGDPASPYRMTKMFLVKTDSSGKELWNRTYGTGWGSGTSVIQTSDGGYMILGEFRNDNQIHVVKTDPSGYELWNATYGGNVYYIGKSLAQTSDGGYVVTGGTGRTLSEFKVYMAKIDANGRMLWNQTYQPGDGCSVFQMADGGYAIAAISMEKPFIIRTDAKGDALWNKTYSLSPDTKSRVSVPLNILSSAIQTSDGGFALIGTTGSLSFDMTKGSTNISSPSGITFNMSSQLFLLKTDANGNELWSRTYGDSGTYDGNSVVQTDDGGYALLGEGNNITRIDMKSLNISELNFTALGRMKIYLFKTDANGKEVWNATYGGDKTNKGISIVKSGDGGYVLAGDTNSFGKGDMDIYMVKVA